MGQPSSTRPQQNLTHLLQVSSLKLSVTEFGFRTALSSRAHTIEFCDRVWPPLFPAYAPSMARSSAPSTTSTRRSIHGPTKLNSSPAKLDTFTPSVVTQAERHRIRFSDGSLLHARIQSNLATGFGRCFSRTTRHRWPAQARLRQHRRAGQYMGQPSSTRPQQNLTHLLQVSSLKLSVTEFGFRTALFFTRAYNRISDRVWAAALPALRAIHGPLKRAFDNIDAQVNTWANQVNSSPAKLDTFTPSVVTQAELEWRGAHACLTASARRHERSSSEEFRGR